jgi:hypothetical protein
MRADVGAAVFGGRVAPVVEVGVEAAAFALAVGAFAAWSFAARAGVGIAARAGCRLALAAVFAAGADVAAGRAVGAAGRAAGFAGGGGPGLVVRRAAGGFAEAAPVAPVFTGVAVFAGVVAAAPAFAALVARGVLVLCPLRPEAEALELA